MALPHQVLPVVATLDALGAVLASVHLGLVPVKGGALLQKLRVNSHVLSQDVLAKTKKAATAAAAAANADKASSAARWLQSVTGQRRDIVQPPHHSVVVHVAEGPAAPRKLLFVLLGVCLARCATIVTISESLTRGLAHRRAGGRPQDWSNTAVTYSVVCVISMLVDLSILNLLFQSRGLTKHDRPDTSVRGILGQLDASSFAAEQLFVSALEWIFFVVVMGTNKALTGQNAADEVPVLEQEQPSALDAAKGYTIEAETSFPTSPTTNATAGQSPGTAAHGSKKDYGSIGRALPPAESSNGGLAAPVAETSTNSAPSAAVIAAAAFPPSAAEAAVNGSGEASADNSTLGVDAADGGDGSDIVDMPRDRRQSMQGARERLQRARENGKVRRRSLWKKIRGKGDGSETPPLPDNGSARS